MPNKPTDRKLAKGPSFVRSANPARGPVTLELLASMAVIQPIATALKAGLTEQEQRYPGSAVLP